MRCLYAGLFLLILWPPAISGAADYYFRPTSLAMVGNWNRDLSFTVSNPGKNPVVLSLKALPSGLIPLAARNRPVALEVFPARVLLLPGESKSVKIDYFRRQDSQAPTSYELVVEQLPILFVKPGGIDESDIMTVTRYTASIDVRLRDGLPRQFAMQALEDDSSVARAQAAASSLEANAP